MDFENEVSQYYLDNSKEHKVKSRTLHVSELGYCPRKIYYKRFMRKQPDSELLRIFRLGDILHEEMTDIFRERFQKVKSERHIMIYVPTTDTRIAGYYDDLIETEDGDRYIIEKKSTKDISKKSSPNEHHKVQLNTYLKALGLDEGYLVYMDKKNMKIKEFKVEYDPELFQETMDKAAGIQKCLDDDVLPSKDPMGWECNYACDYKEECQKNLNPAESDEYGKNNDNQSTSD